MAKGRLLNKLRRKPKPLAPSAKEFAGPSPDPHTNLVIADVALRGGAMLARRAVERVLLGSRYTPSKARAILKGRSVSESLVHTTIAKVATSSVPGMIVVGGGLIAKTLYDRSRGKIAELEGEVRMQKMADHGGKEPAEDDDRDVAKASPGDGAEE